MTNLIILTIFIIKIFFFCYCSAQIACLIQNDQTTCHCDPDEKIIDCNSLGLTQFPQINVTMKGYVGLTLAHNNIKQSSIPWEREILQKLPELTVIDFRGNKGLKCDELQRKFERIHLMSSCEYEEEANSRRLFTPRPNEGRSTSNGGVDSSCTSIWCKLKAKLEKTWLKVYAHMDSLWQNVKSKACKLVCKNRNGNEIENFPSKIRGGEK